MTVLELIRKLIELPPDMEVVVKRSGQRREMKPLAVIRLGTCVPRGTEPRHATVILTDWKEPK